MLKNTLTITALCRVISMYPGDLEQYFSFDLFIF